MKASVHLGETQAGHSQLREPGDTDLPNSPPSHPPPTHTPGIRRGQVRSSNRRTFAGRPLGCYFREPGATQRNRAERRAPLRSPTRQGTHKSSKTLPTPQTTLKVHTQALQLTPSPPARSTRPEPTKSVSQATLSSLNLRKQSVSVLLKHKPRSKRSELT